MNQPHISIKADAIFEYLGFPVTNSILLSLIVLGFFFLVAISYSSETRKAVKSTLFFPFHALVFFVYDFFRTIMKEKNDKFFPLLGSLFFFILLNNWFGLLPGVGSIMIEPKTHNKVVVEETAAGAADKTDSHDTPVSEEHNEGDIVEVAETQKDEKAHAGEEHHYVPLFRAATADLNLTLGLALVSFMVIQIYSIIYLGVGGFVQRFFSSLNPISIIVGILEVVSEFSKIISFSFRLFGNILAGEILIAIIAFLIPVLATFPLFIFEIFVGIMQALVFSMLTAVFLNLATEKSHH